MSGKTNLTNHTISNIEVLRQTLELMILDEAHSTLVINKDDGRGGLMFVVKHLLTWVRCECRYDS